MSTSRLVISWLLRVVAAFIMAQSLFFKFSGAEESIYIFSTLGMEPWGRIATGIAELVACILLLVPLTTWIGAGLGAGTMSGAIFFHLTTLGIEVKNDGGQLFLYAIITFLSCIILLAMQKQKIPNFVQSTFSR